MTSEQLAAIRARAEAATRAAKTWTDMGYAGSWETVSDSLPDIPALLDALEEAEEALELTEVMRRQLSDTADHYAELWEKAQAHAAALAGAAELFIAYDGNEDFSGVTPMLDYAAAIEATRQALSAYNQRTET